MRTLLLVLVILLSACSRQPAAAPATAIPVVSPLVRLLRAGGLSLSDGATVTSRFGITLDGARYEVLEWRDAGESGIQVTRAGGLLGDEDVVFGVLLSYAWSSDLHGLGQAERARLAAMLAKIREARTKYDALFSVAEGVGPLLEKIDELKDMPVSGIPRIKVGSVTLLEVHNMWDLVCAIPVDVTDACLLEPLLRELNERGAKIEKLLALSDEALGGFVDLLEQQSQGVAVRGQSLKESAEQTIAALQNLSAELIAYAGLAARMESMSTGMATALRNPHLPAALNTAIGWLRKTTGLDVNAAMTAVAGRLDGLAQRLAGLQVRAGNLRGEIDELAATVLGARVQSEAVLGELSARWQPPRAEP